MREVHDRILAAGGDGDHHIAYGQLLTVQAAVLPAQQQRYSSLFSIQLLCQLCGCKARHAQMQSQVVLLRLQSLAGCAHHQVGALQGLRQG